MKLRTPESTYDVVGPDGRLLGHYASVIDAMIHMRSCKPGSRVVRAPDGELLAVRVSRTGSRSTLKGALKKQREPASTLH